MGGGQSGTQTVTQTQKPPAYALPGYKKVMSEALKLYDQPGPEYYPGSTTIPLSPETKMALEAQTNRALQGNPLLPQAQDYAKRVLGGEFLSAGNPYFSSAFSAMSGDVSDRVKAAMARSGRLGSGAETGVMTRELGNLGAKLAFGNYESERRLMDEMSRFAPDLAMADYADIARLGEAGAGWESQAQAELQGDIDRFGFYQNLPWEKLAQLATLVQGGTFGGTTTQKQPIYSSRAGSFLGGASAGGGIGSMIAPGIGTGIGAGIGGLIGLLGG